jgi:hypothetical protein
MDVKVGRDEWEAARMVGSRKFSPKSSLPETSIGGENAPKKRLAVGLRQTR